MYIFLQISQHLREQITRLSIKTLRREELCIKQRSVLWDITNCRNSAIKMNIKLTYFNKLFLIEIK